MNMKISCVVIKKVLLRNKINCSELVFKIFFVFIC